MPKPSTMTSAAVLATLAVALLGTSASAQPPRKAPDPNADWPCVQAKVPRLTSTQIWDGPATEDVKGWFDNDEVRKLVPVLASRRVPFEDAAKSIKTFADGLPAEKRNATLTLLFAGFLANVNDDRAAVISGIERYQQRQKGRAKELEREGLEIVALKEKSKTDPKAAEALQKAEELYNWNVRIFQERNLNLPLACEIPVLIESRAFEIAREIRSHMKD